MPTVQISRTRASRARLAQRFQALADATRLHLLEVLAGGERCVCDLQDIVGARQSLLSFHLKTLREAGLVLDRRAGRWTYYAVTPAGFDGLNAFIQTVSDGVASRSGLDGNRPSGEDT